MMTDNLTQTSADGTAFFENEHVFELGADGAEPTPKSSAKKVKKTKAAAKEEPTAPI